MIEKTKAAALLAKAHVPELRASAVAKCVGVNPVTLRQWVKRGYLELRFTPRPGELLSNVVYGPQAAFLSGAASASLFSSSPLTNFTPVMTLPSSL